MMALSVLATMLALISVEVAQAATARLPTHMVPIKYTLRLVPHIVPIDSTLVDGSVSILMDAKKGGSFNITIHASEIGIDQSEVSVAKVSMTDENNVLEELTITGNCLDFNNEFFIVSLNKEIEKGHRYRLKIKKFSSKLRKDFKGICKSSYQDKLANKTEYMASTAFGPTFARRAFPCFDEPGFKARFEVSLGRLKTMTSIANMPIKTGRRSVEMADRAGYVLDEYQETDPISPHSLAFVISKLSPKESQSKAHVNFKLRSWTKPELIDQVDYMNKAAPGLLKYFTNFFKTDYPWQKLDMVVVPKTDKNYRISLGLLTFSEWAVLYKPGSAGISKEEDIYAFLSSNLATLWFGHLVTHAWWDDYWLQTAMSLYMWRLSVQDVKPEFKTMVSFVSSQSGAMDNDALDSSLPLVKSTNKAPQDIIDDPQWYQKTKSGALVRMLHDTLGADAFQGGLRSYFKNHRFSVAKADDLWQCMTEEGRKKQTLPKGVTVKDIMDSWTKKKGFPVVTVRRDYNAGTANLKQERFTLSSGSKPKGSKDMWWIPVRYATLDQSSTSLVWMSNKEETKVVNNLPSSNSPLIVNAKQNGFYLVNYDERNWRLITSQLEQDHKKIEVMTRIQLIQDSFKLAKAGLLDFGLAMSVSSYFKKEAEYHPWSAAIDVFNYIYKLLPPGTDIRTRFTKYVEGLMVPLFKQYGLKGKIDDSKQVIDTRRKVVDWLCDKLKSQVCLGQALNVYRQWMKSKKPDEPSENPINSNLRWDVYCSAIYSGGQAEWDFAWKRFTGGKLPAEKYGLLYGITCTKNAKIRDNLMLKTITPSEIEQADRYSFTAFMRYNYLEPTLDFIEANWASFYGHYKRKDRIKNFEWVMLRVLGNRRTEESLKRVKKFRDDHATELSGAKELLDNLFEELQVDLDWMKSNTQNVETFLKKKGFGPAS